jgi:hypothetical protein
MAHQPTRFATAQESKPSPSPGIRMIGPVTAKVCVLAKALRNTRFVKSTAPDPQ